MIRRNTWIILGVFAVLLIVVLVLQREPDVGSSQNEPTAIPQPTVLLDITAREVQELRIEGEGKTVVYALNEEGTWTIVQPSTIPEATDSARIEQAVSQVANFQILSELSSPPKLAEMGLDNPAYTLRFTLEDGDTITLFVGGQTPVENGYYVAPAGLPPKVVANFAVETFLELFRQLPIVETPTPTEMTGTPAGTGTPEPTGTPES